MADRSSGTSRRRPRNSFSGSRTQSSVRTQSRTATETQRRRDFLAPGILGVSVSLWLFLLCVLGPLCVAHPSAARNGTIRGRVELRRPTPPAERRPGGAEARSPAPRGGPKLLRSGVFLQ